MIPSTRPSPACSACTARALPAPSAPYSPQTYYDIWSEWEKEALPGRNEQRDVAVATLRDCLERKAPVLDLSRLNLSSLPAALPDHIEVLNAYENMLDYLPTHLPASLTSLNLSNNCLCELPRTLPPNLTRLSASCNLLTSLPSNLPEGLVSLNLYNNLLQMLPDALPSTLRRLDLNDNQIAWLPENLPDSLQDLRVADNLLGSLPARLPASLHYLDLRDNLLRTFSVGIINLSSHTRVSAEGNPLSERTLRSLFRIASEGSYHGPQILFSLSVDRHNPAGIPLSEAIKDWLAPEQWIAFEHETNARAFSSFLRQLAENKNTHEDPAFNERVANWLRKVAADPSLRQETFALAQEATSSCEDRITLAFNSMQQAALVRDVENGVWDNKLTELITTGREMFRLEQLERIAREKVDTLRLVDEIEVYLAYQTALRRELQLSSVAELMRFYGCSGVTQQDLNRALVEVRSKENSEFASWLPKWAPWKRVLQRLCPAFVERLQNKQESTFCQLFPRRVADELTAAGVANIPDAEAFMGKKIWDEMLREYDIAFTQDVMLHRYLSKAPSMINALDAVRELAAIAVTSPPLAATIIAAKTRRGEHIGSRLATLTGAGGMAPLVDAWISLLYLLYGHQQLSGEQITSLLLPDGKYRGKSLAFALAGAAWPSSATTRLCALLASIALNDERQRPRIVAGLSYEQTGSSRRLQLARPADFYKLAKRAEKFWPNEQAKALLRQNGLIPHDRELWQLASPKMEVCIDYASDFASLQQTINAEVTLATMGAWETMEKGKAQINRAKMANPARLKES